MATSTAHRAPPSPEAPREERSFSLRGRLDAALAPEATSQERDALVYALSRPLPPEASAREHADLLLSVLGDETLRGMTGSGGRTVKSAAIRALLALGYPYALELPPEAIEALEVPKRRGFLRDPLKVGKTLIVGNALVPVAAVFTLLRVVESTGADLTWIFIATLVLWSFTLLPLFLLLKGRKRRSWLLKGLGSGGLVLSGLAVGAFSWKTLTQVLGSGYLDWTLGAVAAFYAGGLLFSAAQLASTYLLNAPAREE